MKAFNFFPLIFCITISTIFFGIDRLISGYWAFERFFHPIVQVDEIDRFDVVIYFTEARIEEDIKKLKVSSTELVKLKVRYMNQYESETVSIDDLVATKCRLEKKVIEDHQSELKSKAKRDETIKKAKEINLENCK